MISVLMPSRKRPQLALKAIKPFIDNEHFEVIVAIDEDDDVEAYTSLPCIVHITRPHTYKSLHKYYNEMCKIARGSWLMLFNDDAELTSTAQALWEAVDEWEPSEIRVLNPYNEQDNLFPIISRKLYDVIGHFSLNAHVDSWVQEIGQNTNTQEFIGAFIRHFREDMTDETRQFSKEAVTVTAPEYNSEAMTALRQIDISKVKEWLNANNN